MTTSVSSRTHRRTLVIVGGLTLLTLVLTAGAQIYDTNLYVLAEATALLAGDRPGVDFFWWGTPLEAYTAAAAQLLTGGRLIGEFLRQWLYIVAGVVIAFHLGLRLSRSVVAVLVMLAPTLIVLANTPTYHASKLLFFPLFTWVAWRYLDAPHVRRAAVVGLMTALGFLTRHDYGIYLGVGSLVAAGIARVTVPASRSVRSMMRDSAAYAAAVVVVLAPWAVQVQRTEGLSEYVQSRFTLYEAPGRSPYATLLDGNPLRLLMPPSLPPPAKAEIRFFWQPEVDAARQRELEQQFELRLLDGPDNRGRLRYEVATAHDLRFLELAPFLKDTVNIPWEQLEEVRGRVPSRENANRWLRQVALVVPLVLLASGGWMVWRRRGEASSVVGGHMIVAGALLAVVDAALFQEPGYVVVTVPLTAALSARFLTSAMPVRAAAVVVLAATVFAAAVWAQRAPIFLPDELPDFLSSASRRLFASPPASAETRYRYLYECTAPGDRLLVTGDIPGLVSYYANRPMAGGHTQWDHGWRMDPSHEAQSLELLQRQSVPFAFSTHDAVLTDFEKYPRIHAYLKQHYAPLEGASGTILVDTRRQPTGRFGPLGYPCFR